MNNTETPILDAKEAVRLARQYFSDLYSDTTVIKDGFLLEQIEKSEDGKVWEVTFGFDTDRPTLTAKRCSGDTISAGRGSACLAM